MADITEKRILVVEKQLLTSDGTKHGEIIIDKSYLFRVGQNIQLHSDTIDFADYQVKRIVDNSIFVGDPKKPIQDRSDITAYLAADNATIEAREQLRPKIPEQEIERYTYEEEPVVARRVVLIDQAGGKYNKENPVPSIISDGEDTLEVNPDGSINVNIVESITTPQQIITLFSEISNVLKDTVSTVGTYVASVGKKSYLQRITIGGSNFANFALKLNGDTLMRKRTWAGSELHTTFEFDGYSEVGKELAEADILTAIVEHSRPFNGDFEVTFQVLEVG